MMQSSTMHIFEMMLTGTTNQTRANAGFFNTDYALRLYSGPRPTSAQIAALTSATAAEASYAMTRMPALLTSLGGGIVATTSAQQSGVLPVAMKPNKITLAFGQIGLQLSSVSDEAPACRRAQASSPPIFGVAGGGQRPAGLRKKPVPAAW